MQNSFRYFNSSPEVIRLAVMLYIRYPLSLRQVEDLLFELGVDICHETVRFWSNRFGPMFAAEGASPRARVPPVDYGDKLSPSQWYNFTPPHRYIVAPPLTHNCPLFAHIRIYTGREVNKSL